MEAHKHPLARFHRGLEDSFDEFFIAMGYGAALRADMCAQWEEWE